MQFQIKSRWNSETVLFTCWQSFDDGTIAGMSRSALAWWRVWKSPIMEICKVTGKLSGGDNAGA